MVYQFYLYEPHCDNQYALLCDRFWCGYRNVPLTNTQTDGYMYKRIQRQTEVELSRKKETDGEAERKENGDEKQEHM